MNRRDWQNLAEIRLAEAWILFQNRRYDGAYYLAGYVIECALKACVSKKTKRHDFPDKDFAVKVYNHRLRELVEPAGLVQVFKQEFQQDPTLAVKWGIVKDWSEQGRYETHNRRKAKDMLTAVDGPQGVLACIKKYW